MNMVHWPTPGVAYDVAGGGGLYAFLVIPHDDKVIGANEATVCTYTYLTEPDVCVSADEDAAKLWEPRTDEPTTMDRVQDVRRHLERSGREDLSLQLGDITGYDQLSVPLHASVYLGSTGSSLYLRGTGDDEGETEYFRVTYDALTDAGKAVFDGLLQAYGIRPLIITLLDT